MNVIETTALGRRFGRTWALRNQRWDQPRASRRLAALGIEVLLAVVLAALAIWLVQRRRA
jgi:hypothetical protein